MIIFSCGLLLNELKDSEADEELMRRVRKMVKRILAKS